MRVSAAAAAAGAEPLQKAPLGWVVPVHCVRLLLVTPEQQSTPKSEANQTNRCSKSDRTVSYKTVMIATPKGLAKQTTDLHGTM